MIIILRAPEVCKYTARRTQDEGCGYTEVRMCGYTTVRSYPVKGKTLALTGRPEN